MYRVYKHNITNTTTEDIINISCDEEIIDYINDATNNADYYLDYLRKYNFVSFRNINDRGIFIVNWTQRHNLINTIKEEDSVLMTRISKSLSYIIKIEVIKLIERELAILNILNNV